MQIDDDKAERTGASLEALNARIARLAMALDVPLEDESAVQALMATPLVNDTAVIASVGPQTSVLPTVHVTSERRKAHQLEELRGLLLLRCHLETNSITENGLALTRQMLVDGETHLTRQGFKHGADGLGLDHMFDVP
jgi:hypothetical protein